MALDPDSPDVRAAVLGKQVEDFLETDIGLYILGHAEAYATHAMRQLETVSPWRRNRIRDLQNQIKVSKLVISWLSEAITSGQQAAEVLETYNA